MTGMLGARRIRPVLLILVLSSASLSVALMQTVMVPLLPELPRLLDVSPEDASWLVSALLLAGVVALPSVTRLADMYGKRRMILVSLVFLLAGSLLGVVGSGLPILILARVLQGASIAVTPVAMSIMRDELPRDRLPMSIALVSVTVGLGGAVGLPLTGIAYSVWGWHAIFWMASFLAIIALAAVIFFVPESGQRTGGRFDIVGAVLLSGLLLLAVLATTKGNDWGWRSPTTIGCYLGAAVLSAIWVPWQLRCRQPMVDLRTTMERPVLLTNIAAIFTGFAMFANSLGTTQELQVPASSGYGLGLSVLETGVLMAPSAVLFVIAAPLAARLTRRRGARTTLICGFAIMAAGYVVRLGLMSNALEVITMAAIVSVGMTLCFSALPILIMQSVPAEETAAANGINALTRNIGLVSASAIVAALLSGITENVGGQRMPSETAFFVLFVVGGLASLLGILITLGIPRREPVTEAAPSRVAMPTALR